jgi:hypothetical protein
MLLSICEFRENWRREGCTFLIAVNEITLTTYRKIVSRLESKEILGKVCVLRHEYTICNLVLIKTKFTLNYV